MDLVRQLTSLFFIAISLAILLSVDPIVNIPDLGWHIRAGERILSTFQLPHTAWFCFSIPNHPWVAHEWLQDILLFTLWDRGSLTAIRIWFALLGLGFISLMIFKSASKDDSLPFLTFLILLSAGLLVATRTLRPQFVSLAFFSILYFILSNSRKSLQPRIVITIPLLFFIWANLHAGFPIGFLLIGSFAAGLLIEGKWQRSGQICSALVLALIATLINPYGLELYGEIFQTISDPFPRTIVVEWLPTSLASHTGEAFFLVCSLLIFVLIRKKPPVPPSLGIPLVVFLILGQTATRHAVFFIVVSLPIFYQFRQALQHLIEKELKFILISAAAIAIAASFLLIKFRAAGSTFSISQEQQMYPTAALAALKGRESNQRLFHNVEWGGYLLLHNPNTQTFIDGRMTQWLVDGKSFLRTYVEIKDAQPGWEQHLDNYDIQMVLIKKKEPLFQALGSHPKQWTLQYDDNQVAIYERAIARKD